VQAALYVHIDRAWTTRPPAPNPRLLASFGLDLRWAAISVQSTGNSDVGRIRTMAANRFLRVNITVRRVAE
jgi:hypothetical protein